MYQEFTHKAAVDAAAEHGVGLPPAERYPETPYVRPLTRAQKAQALVECGECLSLAEARAFLEDMGE